MKKDIPVTDILCLCEVAKEKFFNKIMLLIKSLLPSIIYKPVAIQRIPAVITYE